VVIEGAEAPSGARVVIESAEAPSAAGVVIEKRGGGDRSR
jgi:hypothetical protein